MVSRPAPVPPPERRNAGSADYELSIGEMMMTTLREMTLRYENAEEQRISLESATSIQKSTIDELRQALLHLANRTHPHSDGCSGCLNVLAMLKTCQPENQA